jgi:hypothetical protein
MAQEAVLKSAPHHGRRAKNDEANHTRSPDYCRGPVPPQGNRWTDQREKKDWDPRPSGLGFYSQHIGLEFGCHQ